ncbi:uncharacterized protein [Triticum aestivum]|uniref:uncharacterized protein n=1 Tax=Triticum aestivum TaxID=4565 RepID=UPI001D0057B6|nr:uncharacterized protein LOC123107758 [Triticum aestivum]
MAPAASTVPALLPGSRLLRPPLFAQPALAPGYPAVHCPPSQCRLPSPSLVHLIASAGSLCCSMQHAVAFSLSLDLEKYGRAWGAREVGKVEKHKAPTETPSARTPPPPERAAGQRLAGGRRRTFFSLRAGQALGCMRDAGQGAAARPRRSSRRRWRRVGAAGSVECACVGWAASGLWWSDPDLAGCSSDWLFSRAARAEAAWSGRLRRSLGAGGGRSGGVPWWGGRRRLRLGWPLPVVQVSTAAQGSL